MRVKDENKELAIRQKAMEMIVEEGFDGLSMQKLAKAANVSPATIYIYFKNREDLLNQLFNDVQETFQEVALKDFDPDLSFEQGLWVQWKNRLKFILKYPVHFAFMEQFRNSPLVNHSDIKGSSFKESMHAFVRNAIKRGEMTPMAPELFWAVAYGPFYALVKFHLQERSMMNDEFKLTDAKMKLVFNMVIKAFRA
jgi:TetR/AcrR family transcriptional repressor of multidrug resistance operon